MRRGKRVKIIEFPYEDPEIVVYPVPEGIPVEIPERISEPVPTSPERKENDNTH